jgi:hypothetical protein
MRRASVGDLRLKSSHAFLKRFDLLCCISLWSFFSTLPAEFCISCENVATAADSTAALL